MQVSEEEVSQKQNCGKRQSSREQVYSLAKVKCRKLFSRSVLKVKRNRASENEPMRCNEERCAMKILKSYA